MNLYPAFLLLLLACSAHVTFGIDSYDSYEYTLIPPFVKRSAFDSYESFESYDPIPLDAFDTSAENGLGDPVHLVKRGASAGDCSAGCAPPTGPVWQNNVCKCLTPEQQQNAVASAMDGLLGGLVKRSAASDSCSYGCAVMMHNVCQKCMTAEERQIHDQNMENLDQNMEDLEKRFQNNPWLSGLVKRSASASECSPGDDGWECIGNVCTCYDGKSKRSASGGDNSLPSARDIIDSTKDKIRKDFEKNPLLSGLVKRSASASECRAGCAPPTKEIWQSNEEGHVCKCLRPEQYLP